VAAFRFILADGREEYGSFLPFIVALRPEGCRSCWRSLWKKPPKLSYRSYRALLC